jgi:hypothetical protein
MDAEAIQEEVLYLEAIQRAGMHLESAKALDFAWMLYSVQGAALPANGTRS